MNDKMSFNENLLKYARLIVKAGVNVQKGQIEVIDAPVENAKLARMIAKEAYLAGAGEVVVKYKDEVVSKYKYEYEDIDNFGKVPEWFVHFRNDYAKKNAAIISIQSNDPEGLKGIDP